MTNEAKAKVRDALNYGKEAHMAYLRLLHDGVPSEMTDCPVCRSFRESLALLAHEAPKDKSAKTVPMEMLRAVCRMVEFDYSRHQIDAKLAEFGYTVTESGKEEGR